MFRIFILLCSIAGILCDPILEPGLRVKFGVPLVNGQYGKDFYINVPRNVSAAINAGWKREDRAKNLPLQQLVMYCRDDRIVCVLLDDTDNVAGLQVSIPKDAITDSPYDWSDQGYSTWIPSSDNGRPKAYWSTTQYYVSEEGLSRSKKDRLKSRDKSRILQEGAVWLTGFDGEIVRVPMKENDIKNTIFTKQGCVPGMGLHYFYNVTEDTTCGDKSIFPYFVLVHNGELNAVAAMGFGSVDTTYFNQYEEPTRHALNAVLARGPKCIYDMMDTPQSPVTLHTYFVDKPELVLCDYEDIIEIPEVIAWKIFTDSF